MPTNRPKTKCHFCHFFVYVFFHSILREKDRHKKTGKSDIFVFFCLFFIFGLSCLSSIYNQIEYWNFWVEITPHPQRFFHPVWWALYSFFGSTHLIHLLLDCQRTTSREIFCDPCNIYYLVSRCSTSRAKVLHPGTRRRVFGTRICHNSWLYVDDWWRIQRHI